MADERVAQLIRQGQTAAQAGNSDMARNYLQAATDLEPDNATAWLWLAGVETDLARAREALERVLELEPDNVRAQQGLYHVESQLASQPAPVAPPAPAEPEPPTPRGTSTLGPLTGPLTIEQELRAALRAETPAQPMAAPEGRGGAQVYITSVVVGEDDAPRSNDDMPYRVAVLALTLLLVIGMVFFTLVLLGVGPFTPRV